MSARPLFNVVVGDDTLARLCELSNGTVIAPGALVDWLPAAIVETVVFDGRRTVTSVSHKRTLHRRRAHRRQGARPSLPTPLGV